MAVPYALHLSSSTAEKPMTFATVRRVAAQALHAVPGLLGKPRKLRWGDCSTAGHSPNCEVLQLECTPAHVASFTQKLAVGKVACSAVAGWELSSEEGSSEDELYIEPLSSSESEEEEEEEEEPAHKRRRLDTQRWMDDIGRITVAELVAAPVHVRNRIIDLALAIDASKKD